MLKIIQLITISLTVFGCTSVPLNHALYYAAEEGNVTEALRLVTIGVPVDVPADNGNTPLHIAASKGHLPMVKMLIKNSANINAYNRAGFTPLHQAAKSDHYSVAQTLLDNDARVDAKTKLGMTPLMISLMVEVDENKMGVILKTFGLSEKVLRSKITSKDPEKLKAYLIQMAKRQHIGEAQLFKLYRLLQTSNKPRSERIAILLINNGANVNTISKGDYTPVIWAAASGARQALDQLLERGVNLEARAFTGDTALFASITSGNYEIANMLIERGADTTTYFIEDISVLETAFQQVVLLDKEGMNRELMKLMETLIQLETRAGVLNQIKIWAEELEIAEVVRLIESRE